MQKRSFPLISLATLVLLAATAGAAELAKPPMQISQDGALGYDWKDWRTVASASRDAKLKWRVGTYAVSPLLDPKDVRGADASLAHLFDEERDRSTVVITDTPWRRGGIMTMGMRLEF